MIEFPVGNVADEVIKRSVSVMAVSNFNWLIEGQVAGHAQPFSEDDLRWLYSQGIRTLVHMERWSEDLLQKANRLGMVNLCIPVADLAAPSLYEIQEMIDFMLKSVLEGKPVGVSCSAGHGRTGTVLACYLVALDHTAEGLVIQVRQKRPGAVETRGQFEVIRQYVEQLFKE
jgi:atypical dual specificity phosphatase